MMLNIIRNGLLRHTLSVLLLMTIILTPCQAAVEFDGVDDYIDLGNLSSLSLSGTNKLSISIWANWDPSGTPIETIFGWQQTTTNNFIIMHTAVGAEGALAGVGGGYGEILTNINGWHHWLMVYNGSEIGNANRLLFYLDGVQQVLSFTGTVSSTIPNILATAKIGSQDCCIGRNWAGLVEDLRMYNRTLTPTEVQILFNSRSKRPSGSLANGLIAHYEMDDDAIGGITAQAKDSSGNLNHGQFMGFTDLVSNGFSTYVPPQIGTGYSLAFDGIDDFIQIPNLSSQISNSFSICSWALWNHIASDQKLFHAQDGGGSEVNLDTNNGGSGNRKHHFYTSSVGSSNNIMTSGEDIIPGNLYHVCGVYNDTNRTKQIFIDSVIKNSQPTSVKISWPNSLTRLGRRLNNNEAMNGTLDDVRIYNKALTNGEISYLYNGSGSDPGTSNLQALWTFDDDSAFKDSSGNNNHGVGVGGDSLKYTDGVLRR